MSFSLPSTSRVEPNSIFSKRLKAVRERIRVASHAAGRNPLSIRLIGSSRDLMVDPVIEAAQAGLAEFNEDFVPEGVTKRPPVDRTISGLVWHFSGTLNTKNMPIAVEFFDVLHSIERVTQVRSLAEAIEKKNRSGIHVLIEVNPLGEKKRMGAAPSEIQEVIEALSKVSGATVIGFSCKTEAGLSREDGKLAFAKTQELHAKALQKKWLPSSAVQLSMGRSHDFEDAIEFGATMLRLGSALFSGKPTR